MRNRGVRVIVIVVICVALVAVAIAWIAPVTGLRHSYCKQHPHAVECH